MQIQLLSGVEEKGLREYRTMRQDHTDPNQLKRLGVLIGLKIDWNRTGEKLRWGYLRTESLRARGLNDAQIANLKAKLAEAEAVYTKLGGDRKDFAKAIVEGNGNRDQIVRTTVDYDSLGNISIRPEERVLLTAPAQLLMDIKAAGLGNISSAATDTNQNAVAFEKATDTLAKISQIANGVSTVTGSLATITNKEIGANASIDDAPPAQAGFGVTKLGSWLNINKQTVMAGGALLLAGFFITKMKHADDDPGRQPKAGRKPKRASKKRKSKSVLGSLGIIELS